MRKVLTVNPLEYSYLGRWGVIARSPAHSRAPLPFLKIIVCFVAFGILYIEPLTLAGMKWAHIWKVGFIASLMVALTAQLAIQPRLFLGGVHNTRILLSGALFAVWPLVPALFSSAPQTALYIVGVRSFPLLLFIYLISLRMTDRQLHQLLVWTVWFVALSAIPFLLGWLEPIGHAYNLANIFGSNSSGFVGVFQNAHAASLSFGMCSVFALVQAVESQRLLRRLSWTVPTLLLATLTALTHARSGMVVLLVGTLCYSVMHTSNRKSFRIILLSLGIIGMTYTLLPDPSGFVNRLLGKTVHTRAYNIETFSSGRTMLASAALTAYLDAEPRVWLIGADRSRMLGAMEERVGKALTPHNGFVEELASHGIVGLLLLLGFLLAMIMSAWLQRGYRKPALPLALSFCAFGLFQGFDYPLQIAFVMCTVMTYPGARVLRRQSPWHSEGVA